MWKLVNWTLVRLGDITRLQELYSALWCSNGEAHLGCGQGLGIFLLATASRPALGLTQPSVKLVPGVERPRREADHSRPSSAEVKNAWSYAYTYSWHGT
jgi:hypothetical protein